VTTSYDRGSIYLLPVDATHGLDPARIVWKQDDQAKPRPVHAGVYRLANFQIERESGGRDWILSATAPDGPEVVVHDGQETAIDISPHVRIGWEGRLDGKRYALSLGLTGHAGMELSLFDTAIQGTDPRVPARFELRERDGTVVTAGTLVYG